MHSSIDSSEVRRLWERMLAVRNRLLAGMTEGLPALAALDLTVPQSMVLFRLVEEGPKTITELCTVSGRSQGATSHLVAQLEERELLSRGADDADGRRTRVSATARGRELIEQVQGLRVQALEDALRTIDPAVVRRLDAALAETLAALSGGER